MNTFIYIKNMFFLSTTTYMSTFPLCLSTYEVINVDAILLIYFSVAFISFGKRGRDTKRKVYKSTRIKFNNRRIKDRVIVWVPEYYTSGSAEPKVMLSIWIQIYKQFIYLFIHKAGLGFYSSDKNEINAKGLCTCIGYYLYDSGNYFLHFLTFRIEY